eukprot:403357933
MSFRAIAEFVLHLEHFRNIDLFQQGLYFLKFQIFNEDEEKIYYANPYDCISKDYETRNKEKASFHKLQEPHLYDEQACFMSKIFFIRYAEETVMLRDIIKFRTEIDVAPGYLNTEFYLKCELFYCLPPQGNFQQAVNSADVMKEELRNTGDRFKLVQTKIYQINGLMQGMSSMIPISFDREFTCLCVSTLHGSIIDFRFRQANMRKPQSSANDHQEGDTFMENGILVEQKYIDALDNPNLQLERQPSKKWTPNNIAEFFFFDEFGFLAMTDKKIEECYGEYTETLSTIYENLKKNYINFSNSVLDDDDLSQIDFPRFPKDLEFKGLESFMEIEQNRVNSKFVRPQVEIKKAKPIESFKDDDHSLENHTIEEQSSSVFTNDTNLQQNSQNNPNTVNDEEEEECKRPQTSIQLSKPNDRGRIKPLPNHKPINHKHIQPKSKSSNLIQASLDKFKENEALILLDDTQKNIYQDPYKVGNAIIMEINSLAGQLFELSNNLSKLLMYKPRRVYKFLLNVYQKQLEDRYGENILRHVIQTSDFSFPSEDYTGQLNDVVAKKTRQMLQMHQELAGPNLLPVEEVKIIEEQLANGKKKRKKRNMEKYAPLIFEECYVKHKKLQKIANTFELNHDEEIKQKVNPNKTKANYHGTHLFVIKCCLPESCPCSSANEQDTEGSIMDMGYKLAQEVHQFIRESCPGRNLGRLTFVGHSLGGLIIRASLPYLEKFKDKFHGYLTLCSPHLGYMYKSSKLFNAGLWVLKKWRKSQCLAQLSMSDHKDLESTTIFELSKQKGLEWFKHIILVSSFQDQYAPFDSARIQICSDAAKDISKGNVYIQMVNNLMKDVSAEVLYRIDVNFQIQETNLDSLIGRTAHILFLENEELMKMIVSRYKDFFS